ncbi:MAG: beta-lactamase family protein [Rhizobiaceae bacterium]|nr:beta-lactamase family protein [Rhizobiaceae bacterium]
MQARLNDVIDRALDSGRITGTVVLVHRDGEPVFRRAAGLADREAGMPVAFDTIFRLASVTKPIVAATALAMVERGLFALSDPVAKYLPWFRPPLGDGSVPDITIHHLLTHTAGLVYDPALERLPADRAISMGLSDTDLDFETNFSRHNAVPLAFPPGTRWAYSFATDILGAAIAAIHGGTLEDAVVRFIAGPLGMKDTRFHVTDPARLAAPYGDAEPRPVRMPDGWAGGDPAGWTLTFSPNRIFNPRAFQSGGAGMVGTATDVMTLFDMLAGGGGDILSGDLVEAGLSNRIGALDMDEPGVRFGYFGAVVTDRRLAMTPQSPGTVRWGGVYGLDWFIDRVNGLTALLVTNNAMEGCTGAFPLDIRDAIYGV